ncbi:MAG TPA: TetR/AcrR family transcriptional regulator [Jatrophihabitans sp.]|jgi:AcrR family transcriptional regulator
MSSIRRVRLSPDARREQLLKLGVQMLATRTLDELSVEDLAEEAGISRGLLFHYFRNKQEFHREVVLRAAQQLLKRTDPNPELAPMEQLNRTLENYLDYVTENYSSYSYLIRGSATANVELRQIIEDTRSEMARRVSDNLHLLGLPDDDLSRLAIRGWLAFTEQVAVQWVPDQKVPRERILQMFASSLPALILASHEPQEP